MMEQGPRIRLRDLWITREKKFISIIVRGLLHLRQLPDLPDAEVELNRCLCFCLSKASLELYPNDELAPALDCKNQPDSDDAAQAKRELKVPDFQWIFLDRYEPDPERNRKEFVVECKRLGRPDRADWVFNVNYVIHGILRFRDPDWGYGKGGASGAMIGYWQSMEAGEVLREVNQMCQNKSLPDLIMKNVWVHGGVSELAQKFERSFEVSPFGLCHLWIDLRR
jgi:hypothetical protein